jgi:transposase-like protein
VGIIGALEDNSMNSIREFFVCDSCNNKDFKLVYNFSLLFHGVNFSNDLIYDKIIDERYQCTQCRKTFSKVQVEEGLAEVKRKQKKG